MKREKDERKEPMYSLFITVTNIDYKEDVLVSLQSAGISRASSVEATNLRRTLSDEFSLFSGFFRTAVEREDEQLIIIALIDSPGQAKEFIANLETTGIDLRKNDILRVAVVPSVLTFDHESGLLEN
jgi:hypothetical protein